MIREDFKSDEEFQFYHWLKDAESAGFVMNISYQPAPYLLSERATVRTFKRLKTKTKQVDKFLFHPHIYTPDFLFMLDTQLFDKFFTRRDGKGSAWVYVDTKGEYLKHGDDGRSFSMNQKWMWYRHKTYVQKIIPEKLFKKTWVPEVARLSKVRKQPVRKYLNCKSFDVFMRGRVAA